MRHSGWKPRIRAKEFLSADHLYAAITAVQTKMPDHIFNGIINAVNGEQAKDLAGRYAYNDPPAWVMKREEVMAKIMMLAKLQSPAFASALAGTGSSHIIALGQQPHMHAGARKPKPGSNISDYQGRNKYGKVLMQVRDNGLPPSEKELVADVEKWLSTCQIDVYCTPLCWL